MKFVSVIILTYNRVKDVIDLLESLSYQTYPHFEVILIDNNSTDETHKVIPERFPSVRYFRVFYNSGVPGGRNFGIVNARGDYLVFVDNDAVVESDFLEKIVSTFEKESQAGILTFKILNYYNKEIDSSTWIFNESMKHVEQNTPVHSFVGCGHAFQREVVDSIGLLWTRLFFLHEEKDYSLRLLHTPYLVYYTPDIIVYHKVSPEKRYDLNERSFYYNVRNIIWIYIRNVSLLQSISFLSPLFVKIFLYSFRKGYVYHFFKGVIEGIAGSREAWQLRKPLPKAKYQQYVQLENKEKAPLLIRLKRFLVN